MQWARCKKKRLGKRFSAVKNKLTKSMKFFKKTVIPSSQLELYRWHASGEALQRLTPPWEKVKILSWQGGEKTRGKSTKEQFGDISKGAIIRLKTQIGPIGIGMVAEHVEHKEGFGIRCW